jgi:hypothetical protein
LSGVSAAMNSSAASKVAKARDDALGAERIRQNSLDHEAQGLNTTAQNNYQDFGEQQQQEATKLGDYFAGQKAEQPSAEAALPTTSSNVTVQEMKKQSDKAKASTDATGQALGKLRSFGDLLGDKSLTTARDAGYIGQIGNFKQGSSNVVPYELDAAGHAGDGMKTFADIAGGLGSVATSAGLSGAKIGNLFGGVTPTVSAAPAATPGFGVGSMAAARAADRASVPGYAGASTLYRTR